MSAASFGGSERALLNSHKASQFWKFSWLQLQTQMRPRKSKPPPYLDSPPVCITQNSVILVRVRVPILDLRVENRAENFVLPDVGVKRFDQFQDAVVATETGIK